MFIKKGSDIIGAALRIDCRCFCHDFCLCVFCCCNFSHVSETFLAPAGMRAIAHSRSNWSFLMATTWENRVKNRKKRKIVMKTFFIGSYVGGDIKRFLMIHVEYKRQLCLCLWFFLQNCFSHQHATCGQEQHKSKMNSNTPRTNLS